MSKFIHICYRNCLPPAFEVISKINHLSSSLIPNIFHPEPTRILSDASAFTAIINPSPIVEVQDLSVSVGIMLSPHKDWEKVRGPFPDGNYALIRVNKEEIEVASDIAGNYTIWYYFDNNVFIASSSQRALVALTGSFEPNPSAISWIMGAGFLGPEISWDKRIKQVKNNHSSIILNRKSWSIEEVIPPYRFDNYKPEIEDPYTYFKDSFLKIMDQMDLDFQQWALPLSGGYDSRTVLLGLKNLQNVRTLTWGNPRSLDNPYSDTIIAQRLAEKFHTQHSFFPIPDNEVPLEAIIDRFLIAGEGRTDLIMGYVDGFNMWKDVFETGISGILRGDCGFTSTDIPKDMEELYLNVHTPFLKFFFSEAQIKEWELPPQVLPEFYQREEGESLSDYQNRYYFQGRLMSRMAAMNDLKLGFTEVFSPLVTDAAINLFSELPDPDRLLKRLPKKFVDTSTPDIPIALIDSQISYKNYLKRKSSTDFLTDNLSAHRQSGLISSSLTDFLLKNLDKTPTSLNKENHSFYYNLKKRVKKILRVKKPTKKIPPVNRLALRAVIMLKMNQRLKEDAQLLKEPFTALK